MVISAPAEKSGPPEGAHLLGRPQRSSTRLLVEIEHPRDGAIVGEPAGARTDVALQATIPESMPPAGSNGIRHRGHHHRREV